MYMGAHVKLTNGGSIALRLHFHDDTAQGKTGKIYIGYIGEHLPLAG